MLKYCQNIVEMLMKCYSHVARKNTAENSPYPTWRCLLSPLACRGQAEQVARYIQGGAPAILVKKIVKFLSANFKLWLKTSNTVDFTVRTVHVSLTIFSLKVGAYVQG